MMDRMIPMMKSIAAKNENAVMLMHTDPLDRAGYFDMMYEFKNIISKINLFLPD